MCSDIFIVCVIFGVIGYLGLVGVVLLEMVEVLDVVMVKREVIVLYMENGVNGLIIREMGCV